VLTVTKVLLSISSLLTDANPDDPLMGSIAREYKTDIKSFQSNASQWTKLYAV